MTAAGPDDEDPAAALDAWLPPPEDPIPIVTGPTAEELSPEWVSARQRLAENGVDFMA